jgi:hypothetical protein
MTVLGRMGGAPCASLAAFSAALGPFNYDLPLPIAPLPSSASNASTGPPPTSPNFCFQLFSVKRAVRQAGASRRRRSKNASLLKHSSAAHSSNLSIFNSKSPLRRQ